MNGLFKTVAQQDYIGISKAGIKAVIEFLNLDEYDISKTCGLSKKRTTQTSRLPRHAQETLEEIGDTINITTSFYEGDLSKTAMWFRTPNPMLNDLTPRDMVRFGMHEKLRKFIIDAVYDR